MVEQPGQGVNFIVKAAELRSKADAALKGGFFSNMFSAKQDRKDDAKELYQQAANCYKHARQPEQAVEMYMKCIECEAASLVCDGGDCFALCLLREACPVHLMSRRLCTLGQQPKGVERCVDCNV